MFIYSNSSLAQLVTSLSNFVFSTHRPAQLPDDVYTKYGDIVPVLEMENEQVGSLDHNQAGQVITISHTCVCKEREEGIGKENRENCLIEF